MKKLRIDGVPAAIAAIGACAAATELAQRRRAVPVPLNVRRAHVGCFDPRLLRLHASLRRAFVIRVAGGGASLGIESLQEAVVQQILLGYGVRPFGQVDIELHVGCGALKQWTAPGNELHGELDPNSPACLLGYGMSLAHSLTKRLSTDLAQPVPVRAIVTEYHRGWHTLPTAHVIRRSPLMKA